MTEVIMEILHFYFVRFLSYTHTNTNTHTQTPARVLSSENFAI